MTTPEPSPAVPGTPAQVAQRDALVASGLLIATSEPGLFARSATFESVVDAFDRMLGDAFAAAGATSLRFPPVIPRTVLERSGYVRSFPDLIGVVTSFKGGDGDHSSLLSRLGDGDGWADDLSPTAASLCPAACHPLYPTLPERLPPGGATYDISGWAFRHEPSLDPARMQAFRQHEIVYVGDADAAVAHRDRWRSWGAETLAGLGLDVTVEVANDPFFGRVGRLLAASQQAAALKYEILAATSGAGPAALASGNCHEAHFGEVWGKHAADGSPAHSACFGFGLERVALALLWQHGLEPTAWPVQVRAALWP